MAWSSRCACWQGLTKSARKAGASSTVLDKDVAGLPAIQAKINFGGGTHKGKTPEVNVAEPVTIYDGRADPARFTLDGHAFRLVQVPGIGLDTQGDRLDLYDAEMTVREFFPRVERFVLSQCPGATRVIAFDHIVRNPQRSAAELAEAQAEADALAEVKGRGRAPGEIPPSSPVPPEMSQEILSGPPAKKKAMPKTPFLQGALGNAHGDYTVRSGPGRAEQLLSPWADRALLDRVLAGRIQIINFWYPFTVVESDPLALCTWRSLSPCDLRTNRLFFKHRIGETYKVSSSPRQRWVCFSSVTPDEAVLLKTYDSLDDGATARFCMHSAFELPEQGERKAAGLPPLRVRESTEVRVLVFYGEGLEGLAKDFVPPHMRQNDPAACEIVGDSLQRTVSIDNGGAW